MGVEDELPDEEPMTVQEIYQGKPDDALIDNFYHLGNFEAAAQAAILAELGRRRIRAQTRMASLVNALRIVPWEETGFPPSVIQQCLGFLSVEDDPSCVIDYVEDEKWGGSLRVPFISGSGRRYGTSEIVTLISSFLEGSRVPGYRRVFWLDLAADADEPHFINSRGLSFDQVWRSVEFACCGVPSEPQTRLVVAGRELIPRDESPRRTRDWRGGSANLGRMTIMRIGEAEFKGCFARDHTIEDLHA